VNETWILAADASAATLIVCDHGLGNPRVLEDFVHPASRLRDTELSTDDRGRTQPRDMGAVRGSAMSQSTSPHDAEAEKFARELGGYLDEAVGAGRCGELILVAPPRFLGLLRGVLASPTSDSMRATISKDYATRPAEEVVELVRKQLDLP
jgi:protein required for attachment to host cells